MSRTVSPCKPEMLYPLNSSSFPLPLAGGNHYSTFHFQISLLFSHPSLHSCSLPVSIDGTHIHLVPSAHILASTLSCMSSNSLHLRGLNTLIILPFRIILFTLPTASLLVATWPRVSQYFSVYLWKLLTGNPGLLATFKCSVRPFLTVTHWQRSVSSAVGNS